MQIRFRLGIPTRMKQEELRIARRTEYLDFASTRLCVPGLRLLV